MGPLEIQVVGRPGVALAPTPDGRCTALLYGEKDRLPRGCETEIGDVFLGEEGHTGDCTWADVTKEAVHQACLAGADLAQIVMSQAPAHGSTCYQLRARFVRCDSARGMTP